VRAREIGLRIVMTGAGGLVGRALASHWRAAGHEIRALVRGTDWDPEAGSVRPDVLRSSDAVVHLAGESIAARRWTEAHKQRIVRSRVRGTQAIAQAIAAAASPPPILLCASAVGFYGDRGDERLDESSLPGGDFLARACVAWEEAADAARAAGARVAHLRLGLVLARTGGALQRMLPVFRSGLGARLGSGRQWMSWIALDDVVAVFDRGLTDTRIAGAVNVVAPAPVRNEEFTRTLGRVLHRPAVLAVPSFALRLLLGEMAGPLLLASARVVPARLENTGYSFIHPTLEPALRGVLQ
jgi:uncharacterized protein (TIGR01777 family)